MRKWEYMVQNGNYTEAMLNVAGQNGWELCGVVGDFALSELYFKRLIE
mgnify:FL=1